LMLHGVGVKPGTSSSTYWGINQANLNGLCTVSYLMTDTFTRGWDNAALQQEYCNAISQYKPNIVFTHSMGNLIVAAGIIRGLSGCTSISASISSSSVAWFSAAAPWLGSPGANAQISICNVKPSLLHPLRTLKDALISKIRSCNELGVVSLQTTYKSPSGITFSQLAATGRSHVSGALCGSSAVVNHPISAQEDALWFLSQEAQKAGLITWNGPNDGMVLLSSCELNGRYSTSSQSAYFTGPISHIEAECHYTDTAGVVPCSWYRARVQQVSSALAGKKF